VDKFPTPEASTVVHVVAQQFNWNVRYPGKDAAFGKQDMHFVTETNLFGIDPNDLKGKDDVQMAPAPEIHVPVNKPVIAYISSKDVIHSFKVIAMRVTQDAIPTCASHLPGLPRRSLPDQLRATCVTAVPLSSEPSRKPGGV
jgi:cytochrome c oxidase subunit 2